MTDTQQPDEVIRRLVQWAEQREPIRAMLLTSTRAVPNAPVVRTQTSRVYKTREV